MRKNSIFVFSAGAILLCLVIFSCRTAKLKKAGCTNAPTYTANIQPVIQQGCSCHIGGRTSGNVDLSTYEKVKEESLTGSLMPAIRHDEGYTPMPKNKPMLSDSTIHMFNCWVLSGAAE